MRATRGSATSAPAGAAVEEYDVPLSRFTTLRVGGPARRLVHVDSEAALISAVAAADAAGEPVLVLGGGSNLVVADAGFDGLVVHVRTRGLRVEGGRVTAAAGEPWEPFVGVLCDRGLAGMECLSGIPGSVGATPIQNVGAYGQDVSQTMVSLRAYDRDSREVVEIAAPECGFGYRSSRFRGSNRFVILSVGWQLREQEWSLPVAYPQLADALGVPVGGTGPLAQVRDAVLALRRAKGMVLDPEDPDTVSAGSFFVNPVLSAPDAEGLRDRIRERLGNDVAPPLYAGEDGEMKTSAAWLIERAGFPRGFPLGPVRISTKHTLALTNPGGGTTADLLRLADTVRTGVRTAFGVDLAVEPVLVGCATGINGSA